MMRGAGEQLISPLRWAKGGKASPAVADSLQRMQRGLIEQPIPLNLHPVFGVMNDRLHRMDTACPLRIPWEAPGPPASPGAEDGQILDGDPTSLSHFIGELRPRAGPKEEAAAEPGVRLWSSAPMSPSASKVIAKERQVGSASGWNDSPQVHDSRSRAQPAELEVLRMCSSGWQCLDA